MASTKPYKNGDKSDEYINDNNGSIFISGFGKNKIIVFKPYLKSFSFSRKMKTAPPSSESFYDLTNNLRGDFEMNYSLSFDVVSVNLQEAKDNHSKFQFLLRFLVPSLANSNAANITSGKLHVKFSNLIHENAPDSYRAMHRDPNKDGDITKIGLYCQIDSLDYNPDLAMGFFEDKGLIFAKSFSLDLKLTVINTNKERFDKKTKNQLNKGEVDNGQLFGFNPRTRGRAKISQIIAGRASKEEATDDVSAGGGAGGGIGASAASGITTSPTGSAPPGGPPPKPPQNPKPPDDREAIRLQLMEERRKQLFGE